MDNDKSFQNIGTTSERTQLLAEIRRKGYISIDDNITFHTIVDVLNDLFDKGYAGWQRAVCHIDATTDVWFPKLDVIKNGKHHLTNKHWHNYFICNQNLLVEYPTKKNDLKTMVWPPQKLEKWNAYVFARHEGSYQFFGEYEIDRIDTASQLGLTIEIKPNDPVRVFKRLDTKAKLPRLKI